MAPATQVSSAPSPNVYTAVKTPETGAASNDAKSGVSPWSVRYRFLAILAQLVIIASIIVYAFGNTIVLTPTYTDKIVPHIQRWWGVPKKQPKGKTLGHAEMTRPTFFTLFSVLPLVVSVLLLEFLRHFNLRRASSQYMLKLALVLRRKPSLFGKVSYWSYGEWIFFLLLAAGNIFTFCRYYKTRYNKEKAKGKAIKTNQYLEALGLTFGFVALFNMAFLFLPATRNAVWMEFFNISYANGIKYHRWIGVVALFMSVMHTVMYYASWIRQDKWRKESLPCFNCDFAEEHTAERWANVFGEISLILFLAMGITAIPIVRRKFYDVFYYSHQLLFLAIIFLALHWLYVIWWLLPTFVLYLFSRTISVSNASSPVEISELTAISEELVKVVIKRSSGRSGHFKVGQFLYLNVPSISKLQWHAFTIASSPRSNASTVTVLLKARGEWTRDLVQYANECQAKNVLPTVYVDGFYGASLEMYQEYSTVCLVAGGIGVTPILSILDDITAKLSSHETLKQKVVFVFSFRELGLLEAIAPALAKLRELDPQQQQVTLHLTLTSLPTDAQLDTALSQPAVQSTQYEDASLQRRAFSQPLRSRTFKSIAYIVSFALAMALVACLEYGTKIKRLDADLWALQLLVEIIVLMLSVAVAVVGVIYIERAVISSSTAQDETKNLYHTSHAVVLEAHTYRELIAEFGVVIGQHPDVASLLQQTYEKRVTKEETIGVFASGPTSLKRDVEVAITKIDSTAFDLRQEEFEL